MYTLANMADPGTPYGDVWMVVGEDGEGIWEMSTFRSACYMVALAIRYGLEAATRMASDYSTATWQAIGSGLVLPVEFDYPPLPPTPPTAEECRPRGVSCAVRSG